MSFRKLAKPTRTTAGTQPYITLAVTTTSNRQVYLALNTAARRALGDPAAVHFEFDDDKFLLRVVASNPEDPAAYAIPKTGRVSVTGMIRDLGVNVTTTTRIHARPAGRLALIADLSDMPAAGGGIVPMRRTA